MVIEARLLEILQKACEKGLKTEMTFEHEIIFL